MSAHANSRRILVIRTFSGRCGWLARSVEQRFCAPQLGYGLRHLRSAWHDQSFHLVPPSRMNVADHLHVAPQLRAVMQQAARSLIHQVRP